MTRHSLAWTARRLLLAVAFFSLLIISAPAQQGPAQAQDAEFARLVKEWTTKPEFLSPLVDHLPVIAAVPSPKDALGYHIGTPKKLTYYADALKYYRTLASNTRRVRVLTIGKTDEGRECVVVFVGSEESMQNLERYREYLGQLADPRRLSDVQARDIVSKAKPIYHLMGGLHSGETGPPEMLMELAYRLAVEASPLISQIRDKVIVSITPAAEPDGRDRYVDWYYRHLIDIAEERDRVAGPPYWGKYIFHDNNRDINYSQVTMRALLDWYLQWHPPIVHDLHESVPFMYTFSGQAPQNPVLDPILYAELPWFSNFEMAQMTKYGMPGVWTHAFVDMWSPGYLGFMASNHNGMLRMYETFGNGGATTMKRRVAPENPFGGEDEGQTSREWYRPLPPYREVEWSMRNNTNYMQTGVLTALQLTSQFPSLVLENFYLKSRNAIESGKTTAPFGFVIPAGQTDPTRVGLLVNLLRRQGIEVGRATAEVKTDAATYPAGSFIVKRDQPYGRLAVTLLQKQEYPDPALRTYDDSAWTLGLALNIEVKPVGEKNILDAPIEPVTEWKPAGRVVDGPASAYLVPHTGANGLITLRTRLKTMRVEASSTAFTVNGTEYPAGSLIIPTSQTIPASQPGGDVASLLRTAIGDLGLTATPVAQMPEVARHEVDLPRLAVFSSWGNTQDVGWVRHALDQFEVPFQLIFKERLRQGRLRESYDVILAPSQGRGSARDFVFDVRPADRPLAYTKTDRFKNLGMYGESEDVSGGMGLEGAAELRKFVEEGGLLVTLGLASVFPPEFGLTRDVTTSRPSSSFYAPGPIVEAEILRPRHPLFYGYREKTVPVRYANGPLLQVPTDRVDSQVLLRFPGGDRAVMSGLMRGANEIRNRPAILDVPVKAGRVLLFTTNPCYRWLNHGEFNMLFNAILHYNDLTEAPLGTRESSEYGSRPR